MSGRVDGVGFNRRPTIPIDDRFLDHKSPDFEGAEISTMDSGGRGPDDFSLHGCGQTDSNFRGRSVTSHSNGSSDFYPENPLTSRARTALVGSGYEPFHGDEAWDNQLQQHQWQQSNPDFLSFRTLNSSISSSSSSTIASGNGRSKKTTEEKTKATWKDLCSFIAFMVSLVTSPLPTLAGVGIAGLYSYYWKGKEVESKDYWGSTTVLVAQTVAMIMGLLGPKAFPNLPKLRFPIQIAGTFIATQVIMQEILFEKKKPEGGDPKEDTVHMNKAPARSNRSSGANSSDSARHSHVLVDKRFLIEAEQVDLIRRLEETGIL